MKLRLPALFQRASTRGANSPAVNSAGGAVFVTYGEAPERAAQRHREVLDTIRGEIARKYGVAPEKLEPIFAHLGEPGLPHDVISARADEAVARILEQARKAPAHSNDGADIAAAIAAARDKLSRVDTAGALGGLAAKIAEEEQARRQRLIPLLREKATIERLTYDHEAAQATLRQMLALNPDDVWGWIDLGDLHDTTGASNEALAAYRRSFDAAEHLARADPGNAGWQRDLSVSHERIGDVQRAQGDLAAAQLSFQAALAIRERLAQADPGNAGWQRDLSVSHDRIGDVQKAQGDLAAARLSFQASLAIRERLAQADPGNAGWQRDLSVSHSRIGDVQKAQGDLAAARLSFQASLAIRERLARADPGNAGWQRDLAISFGRLAMVDAGLGAKDDALAGFRRGRDIIARLIEQSPTDATLPGDRAWLDHRIAALSSGR
jgi:tetratricopeptide (TPR) repeat protein